MKLTTGATFGARRIKRRKLTAKQYLNESRAGTVTKGHFVPPKIGGASFGYFEVELAQPRYEVTLD